MLEGLGTTIEKDGLLDKYRQPNFSAAYTKEWSCLTQNFLKALPYSLTESQMKAVAEIIWDLKRPIPMNRLLQVFFHSHLLPCYTVIFKNFSHLLMLHNGSL